MFLGLEYWYMGYNQILADCRPGDDGAKTALILCNTDVDALAAARIFSYMLRSDGINYQLLPCNNYTSLEKHLSEISSEDVRAVIMLNFGASKNLTRLFDRLLPHETTKVYIIDCRRPVHLANIYSGENVVMFWDQPADDIPSDGDNLSGSESSSSEEEDDDESSDSDDDSSQEGSNGEEEATFDDVVGETNQTPDASVEDPPSRLASDNEDANYEGEDERDPNEKPRMRKRQNDDENNHDGDGDDDDDTVEAGSSPKRQRRRGVGEGDTTQHDGDGATDLEYTDEEESSSNHENDEKGDQSQGKNIPLQELHRQRRDRLRAYYSSGSFFGSPASYVAYQLASQLRFGQEGDLLWLACVGVTDAYLHARLDVTGFTALAIKLREYCSRLFPNDMYERAVNTVYAEDLSGNASGTDRTKITFSNNGRIIAEQDFRFFLLRHSSLLESMVHSDYVSTKLQIWSKPGMQRLQELLAKMGYPLDECQQPFAFMKPTLRRRLREKINAHAEVRCCFLLLLR